MLKKVQSLRHKLVLQFLTYIITIIFNFSFSTYIKYIKCFKKYSTILRIRIVVLYPCSIMRDSHTFYDYYSCFNFNITHVVQQEINFPRKRIVNDEIARSLYAIRYISNGKQSWISITGGYEGELCTRLDALTRWRYFVCLNTIRHVVNWW